MAGFHFDLKRPGEDDIYGCFVPEKDIYDPAKFKQHLDQNHVQQIWRLHTTQDPWKKMMFAIIEQFER